MSRSILVLILCCCPLLTPLAAEAQKLTRVQTHILSAHGFYESLDFEQALEQISLARRLSRTESEDTALFLYEGAVLSGLGRFQESKAAFTSALTLQPDAKLPVEVAPKVAKAFESVRLEVQRGLEHRKAVPVPPPQPVTAARPDEHPMSTPPRRGPDVRVWLPIACGGLMLAGGGGFYALARNEQSKLRSSDASLMSIRDVDQSVSRGRTYQALGLGMAGVGVVGLGIAAGMYFRRGSTEASGTSLGLSTDGTSAFVYGRWP